MANSKLTTTCGYSIVIALLGNLVSAAFLPSYVFAQSSVIPQLDLLTEEESEKRQDAINQAQWDGALSIKSFTLPGLSQDASTGKDDNGVVTDLSAYKNEEGQHSFNTVNFDQMFSGFSEQAHNEYFEELEDISNDPHKLQEATAQYSDSRSEYQDVDCSELPTLKEQQNCELVKNASVLEAIRDNPGRLNFLGEDDPILTTFSPFTDGSHPYFAELQSEECSEVSTPMGEGDDNGLMAERFCLVPTDLASEQQCKAERFVHSTKVAEKVVMSFEPRGDYDVKAREFDDSVVVPCDLEEDLEIGVTCLEVRTLDTSSWTLDSPPEWGYFMGNVSPQGKVDARFAAHVNVMRVEYSSHSIPFADGESQSLLLSDYSDYFDDTLDYSFSAGTALLVDYGYYKNRSNFALLDFGQGGCYDSTSLLIEENLVQGDQTYGNYPENFECRYTEADYSIAPNNTPTELPNFFYVDDWTGDQVLWIDRFVASPVNFNGTDPALSSITNATSGKFTNLSKYRFYFEREVIGGGTTIKDTGIFDNALIDDADEYPKTRLYSVSGEEGVLELDVFDQLSYPVNQYFPTNLRVVGSTVESWSLRSIGRPTNRYQYELEIQFNGFGPFEVIADLHRIDDEGIRPREGESDSCQIIINAFLQNTFPAEARCDYEIVEGNSRTTDSGVLVDYPHIGYTQFMTNWGENGNPPIEQACYEATIIADTDTLGGFEEQDRTLVCSTLSGVDYDNCMNGQYCQADIINGGQACFDIGDSLQRSFQESCANYIADDACSYQPEKTRCEEYTEIDNVAQCLFESHTFECDEGGSGYTMPTSRANTEVVCGSPRDCMNGTCAAIEEESNDAFLRATALQNVASEAKNNSCIAQAGEDDVEALRSCRLFEGEAGRCKQAKVFGAPDCCDPAELGFGSINIVEYWQAIAMLNATTEQMTGAGLMSHAWGAVEPTVAGDAINAVGDQMGAINEFLSAEAKTGYEFVSSAISEGWNSTMSTFGFSQSELARHAIMDSAEPLQALVGESPQWAQDMMLEQVSALGEEYVKGVTGGAATTETITNVATAGAGSANAGAGAGTQTFSGNCDTRCADLFVDDSSQLSGVSKWIAKGVNAVLEEVAPDVAGDIFVTTTTTEGAEEIAFNTTQELGQLAEQFTNIFGTIMLVYQIYSMYRLSVNLAFACDEEDFSTTQKTKLLQTHYIGSHCSKKLFIGGCVEYTQVHCVYESVFARIVSEQIRNVVSLENGDSFESMWLNEPNKKATKDNANCQGFTIDELEALDWDKVDLSEYEQILLSKLKYNPNNMPEDFVKTDYLAGQRDGPSEGITIKEDGSAQALVTMLGSEYGRQNISNHTMVLDDPDYMPWYRPESGGNEGEQCVLSCDVTQEYFYDSGLGLCVKTSYEDYPTTFSCDAEAGYLLHTNEAGELSCRRTTTTPIIIGCRSGYEVNQETGQCDGVEIDVQPLEPTCPVGYDVDYQQSLCVLKEIVAQETNCTSYGDGFSLIDDVCIQTELETLAPEIVCPNASYTVEGDECVFNTTASQIVSCPDGLIYDNEEDQCIEVSTDSMPADLDCTVHGEGYELVGQSCEKTTIVDATFGCDTSDGYSLNADGTCARVNVGVFEPLSSCPVGYLPLPDDDTKCFMRILAPPLAEPYCEDPTFELIDNGICEKIIDETVPAEPLCTNDGVFNSEHEVCELSRSYPATVTCASGLIFNPQSMLCEGTEQAVTSPTLACEDESYSLVDQICVSTEIVGLSERCPVDYTIDESTQTCKKVEVEKINASYWCPPDTVENAGFCYEFLTETVIKTCPSPSIENITSGECEQTVIDVAVPVELCPYPSFRHIDGSCVVKESQDAQMDCPLDEDSPWLLSDTNRLCYRESVTLEASVTFCPDDGSECTNAVYRDPIPTCAVGNANLSAGTCEEYVYSYPDPFFNCDSDNGFTYNADKQVCERLVVSSAVSCGPDFSFNVTTSFCELVSQTTALPDCSPGFAFDGDVCRKVEHSPAVCLDPNETFDLSTGLCIGTEIENTMAKCQSPFVVNALNPAECLLPETYTPSCATAFYPTAYNAVSKQCEHHQDYLQIAPTKTCDEGILVDGMCASGSTEPPSCSSGTTYNSVTNKCDHNLPVTTSYCLSGDLIDLGTGSFVCRTVESAQPTCQGNGYYNADNNQCIETETVQGSMTCLSQGGIESILSGAQCLNYQEVDYLLDDICPEGFKTHTLDKCIKQLETTAPVFNCPDGYFQGVSNQLSVTESPVCTAQTFTQPVCLDGYALDGNVCLKNNDAPPILTCTIAGQMVFGDHCISGSSTSPLCEIGMSLSAEHDVCMQSNSLPANPSCPDDYVYNNFTSQCDSTFISLPICEVGYQFDASNDICSRINIAPSCPDGFTYEDGLDQCQLYEQQNADISCLAGQNDVGTGCMDVTPAVCADGFILDAVLDVCTKIESQPYQEKCSLPYIDNGSECIMAELPNCASVGAVWDEVSSMCLEDETVAALPDTCPVGSILQDEACHALALQDCSYAGDGFSYNDSTKQCENVVPDIPLYSCPDGEVDLGTGCSDIQTPQCSNPSYHYDNEIDQCVLEESIPMPQVCASGVLVDGECAIEQISICNEGDLVNGTCEELQTETARDLCDPPYFENNGTCAQITGRVCPTFFLYDGNDRCVNEDPIDDWFCENNPGHISCQTSAPPNCTPENIYLNNCVQRQDFNTRCDPPYSYNNNQCEWISTSSPSCPVGYTLDGDYCRITQSTVNGECPSGYTANGSQCEITRYESVLCAAQYELDVILDQCVLIVSSSYDEECPINGTPPNCTELLISIPQCEPDYTFIPANNHCLANTGQSQTYSCPSGLPMWTLQGQECERTVEHPPMCDQGLFDSTINQCTYGAIPYNPVCPVGFNDNVGNCQQLLTALPQCEDATSYDPNANVCLSLAIQSYQYDCDNVSGFNPNGLDETLCERYTFEPPACVEGELFNDSCSIQHMSFPTLDCSEFGNRFTLNLGRCESPSSSTLTCEGDGISDESITSSHLQCHTYSAEPVSYWCSQDYSLSGSLCSYEYTLEPVFACETGFILNSSSGQCEREENEVSVNSCQSPATLLDDSVACRELAISTLDTLTYECGSPGFELDDYGRCVLNIDSAVNEYCENPIFTLVPLEDALEDGPQYQCQYVETEYLTPDFICDVSDPPFSPTSTGACERLIPVPAEFGCEPGYLLSDDLSQCEREVQEIVEPDYMCPEPYRKNVYNQCTLTNVTNAALLCEVPEEAIDYCALTVGDEVTGQYVQLNETISYAAEEDFQFEASLACYGVEPCFLSGDPTGEYAIALSPDDNEMRFYAPGAISQAPVDQIDQCLLEYGDESLNQQASLIGYSSFPTDYDELIIEVDFSCDIESGRCYVLGTDSAHGIRPFLYVDVDTNEIVYRIHSFTDTFTASTEAIPNEQGGYAPIDLSKPVTLQVRLFGELDENGYRLHTLTLDGHELISATPFEVKLGRFNILFSDMNVENNQPFRIEGLRMSTLLDGVQDSILDFNMTGCYQEIYDNNGSHDGAQLVLSNFLNSIIDYSRPYLSIALPDGFDMEDVHRYTVKRLGNEIDLVIDGSDVGVLDFPHPVNIDRLFTTGTPQTPRGVTTFEELLISDPVSNAQLHRLRPVCEQETFPDSIGDVVGTLMNFPQGGDHYKDLSDAFSWLPPVEPLCSIINDDESSLSFVEFEAPLRLSVSSDWQVSMTYKCFFDGDPCYLFGSDDVRQTYARIQNVSGVNMLEVSIGGQQSAIEIPSTYDPSLFAEFHLARSTSNELTFKINNVSIGSATNAGVGNITQLVNHGGADTARSPSEMGYFAVYENSVFVHRYVPQCTGRELNDSYHNDRIHAVLVNYPADDGSVYDFYTLNETSDTPVPDNTDPSNPYYIEQPVTESQYAMAFGTNLARVVETNVRLIPNTQTDNWYLEWEQLDPIFGGTLFSQNWTTLSNYTGMRIRAEGFHYTGNYYPFTFDYMRAGHYRFEVDGEDMRMFYNGRIIQQTAIIRTNRGSDIAKFAIGAMHNFSLTRIANHLNTTTTEISPNSKKTRITYVKGGLLDGSRDFFWDFNLPGGKQVQERNYGIVATVETQQEQHEVFEKVDMNLPEVPQSSDPTPLIRHLLQFDGYDDYASMETSLIDPILGDYAFTFNLTAAPENGVLVSQSQTNMLDAGFRVGVELGQLVVIRGGQHVVFDDHVMKSGIYRVEVRESDLSIVLFRNGTVIGAKSFASTPVLTSPSEASVPFVVGARLHPAGAFDHSRFLQIASLGVDDLNSGTPIAYWEFNLSSGNTVTDAINGHILSLQNMENPWKKYTVDSDLSEEFNRFGLKFDGIDDRLWTPAIGPVQDFDFTIDLELNSLRNQYFVNLQNVFNLSMPGSGDRIDFNLKINTEWFKTSVPIDELGRYKLRVEYDGNRLIRFWLDNELIDITEEWLSTSVTNIPDDRAISLGTSHLDDEPTHFSDMTLYEFRLSANNGTKQVHLNALSNTFEQMIDSVSGQFTTSEGFEPGPQKWISSTTDRERRYALLFDGVDDFIETDSALIPSFDEEFRVDFELFDSVQNGTIVAQTRSAITEEKHFEIRVENNLIRAVVNGNLLTFGNEIYALPGHYRFEFNDGHSRVNYRDQSSDTYSVVRGPQYTGLDVPEVGATTSIGARYNATLNAYENHIDQVRMGYVRFSFRTGQGVIEYDYRSQISFNQRQGGLAKELFPSAFGTGGRLYNFPLDNSMWVLAPDSTLGGAEHTVLDPVTRHVLTFNYLEHAQAIETGHRLIPDPVNDDFYIQWRQLDPATEGVIAAQNVSHDLTSAELMVLAGGIVIGGQYTPLNDNDTFTQGTWRLQVQGTDMAMYHNGRLFKEYENVRSAGGIQEPTATFTIGAAHNDFLSDYARHYTNRITSTEYRDIRLAELEVGLLDNSLVHKFSTDLDQGAFVFESENSRHGAIIHQGNSDDMWDTFTDGLPELPRLDDTRSQIFHALYLDNDDIIRFDERFIDINNGTFSIEFETLTDIEHGVIFSQSQQEDSVAGFKLKVENGRLVAVRGARRVDFNGFVVSPGVWKITWDIDTNLVTLFRNNIQLAQSTALVPQVVEPHDSIVPVLIGARYRATLQSPYYQDDALINHATPMVLTYISLFDGDNALIRHVPLNQITGETVTDVIQGAIGTIVSVDENQHRWVTYDKIVEDTGLYNSYGIQFDGVNDHIRVPDVGALDSFEIVLDAQINSDQRQVLLDYHATDNATIFKVDLGTNAETLRFFIERSGAQFVAEAELDGLGRYEFRFQYDGRQGMRMWVDDHMAIGVQTFLPGHVLGDPTNDITIGASSTLDASSFSSMTLYQFTLNGPEAGIDLDYSIDAPLVSHLFRDVNEGKNAVLVNFEPLSEKMVPAYRAATARYALLFDGFEDFVAVDTGLVPEFNTFPAFVDVELIDDVSNGVIISQSRKSLLSERYFEWRVVNGRMQVVLNGSLLTFASQVEASRGHYRLLISDSGTFLVKNLDTVYSEIPVRGPGRQTSIINEFQANTVIGARYDGESGRYVDHMSYARLGYVQAGRLQDDNTRYPLTREHISFNQTTGGKVLGRFDYSGVSQLYNFSYDNAMWVPVNMPLPPAPPYEKPYDPPPQPPVLTAPEFEEFEMPDDQSNEGWEVENGFCERANVIDELPIEKYCDGEMDENGLCQAYVETPPINACPEDSDYDTFSELCESTIPISQIPDLIDCTQSDTHTLNGLQCSYLETFESKGIGCAEPGWVYDEYTGQCSIYLRETQEPVLCESEHEQRFRRCYSRESIDADYICPEGTSQDPESLLCVGTLTENEEPKVLCPDGYNVIGATCVLVEEASPVASCSESSYRLVSNMCFQDTIITEEEPLLSCPDDYILDEGECHFESRISGSPICQDIEWIYNESTALCEKESTTYLRPINGCPETHDDYELIGAGRCARIADTEPLEFTCSVGELTNGQCESTRNVSHVPDYCVYPAELEGGQCVSFIEQRPTFSCDEHRDIIQASNGCARIVKETELPTSSCPE